MYSHPHSIVCVGAEDGPHLMQAYPNGVETCNGQPFLWLGAGETVLEVRSPAEGVADVEATYRAGPSVVGPAVRHVVVAAGGKRLMEKAFAEGPSTIHVPLDAGRNEIVLTCADQPSVLEQANGDTRPLILGVLGVGIAAFEADGP